MKLLNTTQIQQKTKRLAIEIMENNCSEEVIILAGLNNNGMAFAKMIEAAMKSITIVTPQIKLTNIRLNPANPLASEIVVGLPSEELKGKVIVVIDDVANTGRTLQYAMLPLLEKLVKKIEIAVLVDRKHKSYPVHPNYFGMELATTLKDDIEVKILGVPVEAQAVYLN